MNFTTLASYSYDIHSNLENGGLIRKLKIQSIGTYYLAVDITVVVVVKVFTV